MLEILKFIFSSFWTFFGTWILLSVIIEGVSNICIAYFSMKALRDEDRRPT